MTRSTGEEWGLLVKWPSKHDAPCWLRNDDHRPRQPRDRIKYGYNRVQEIVSGTSILKTEHSKLHSPSLASPKTALLHS